MLYKDLSIFIKCEINSSENYFKFEPVVQEMSFKSI